MTLEEAKMTLYANFIYACEKAGFDLSTICMVDDALRTVIAIADRKTESSSEKPNNCEDKPQPCKWCKFFDGENCFSQEPCKVMLYFKDEPQTERSE